MQLIFAPILGRLSDKYGRRPVLLISIIGTGIGFFDSWFCHTLWMLSPAGSSTHYRRQHLNGTGLYCRHHYQRNRAKGMGLIGGPWSGFCFGPAIGAY